MIYVLSYRNEIYEGHGYWNEDQLELAHEKIKQLGKDFKVVPIAPAVAKQIEILYKERHLRHALYVVKCPTKISYDEMARRCAHDVLDLDSIHIGTAVTHSISQVGNIFYVRVWSV